MPSAWTPPSVMGSERYLAPDLKFERNGPSQACFESILPTRPRAPVGGSHRNRRIGGYFGPSARGAPAWEEERMHLAILDHAELEILVEGSARDRSPTVAFWQPGLGQGAARPSVPI